MEYITAKSILQKTNYDNSKWFGIDYNMNLYKGCCHGCIYCDSRSNCYHIENFDKVRIKENVISILNNELKKKRETGVVGIGAMSDTYNPFEQQYQITREALKLIYNYGFGISIDTKSSLITRDVDLLKLINNNSAAIVKITVTTADDELSRIIEPKVCVTSERFKAVEKLSSEGIFVGVLLTPVLPFITDNEENIKQIVYLAHKNGARFVYPMFGVTLRENQREYFYEKLDILFPGIKFKYTKLYGEKYVCNSPNVAKLEEVFETQCKRYGLLYKMEDIIKAYKIDKQNQQLSLF